MATVSKALTCIESLAAEQSKVSRDMLAHESRQGSIEEIEEALCVKYIANDVHKTALKKADKGDNLIWNRKSEEYSALRLAFWSPVLDAEGKVKEAFLKEGKMVGKGKTIENRWTMLRRRLAGEDLHFRFDPTRAAADKPVKPGAKPVKATPFTRLQTNLQNMIAAAEKLAASKDGPSVAEIKKINAALISMKAASAALK